MELVMASANPDKVAEISSILQQVLPGAIVRTRPAWVPDVVEDGDTLLGNAALKARALCQATGAAAVADDTGLFVDALGDRPGVFSARYAGGHATYADNCAKLLDELASIATADRGASFRTVALVAWPDGTQTWAEGRINGSIAEAPRGAAGFGYDPLFVPDSVAINDDGRPITNALTFAELGVAVKDQVSHRRRAFQALAVALAARS